MLSQTGETDDIVLCRDMVIIDWEGLGYTRTHSGKRKSKLVLELEIPLSISRIHPINRNNTSRATMASCLWPVIFIRAPIIN